MCTAPSRLSRLLIAFLALLAGSTAWAAELAVPNSHPRLWFGNPDRLSQAQAYFQTTPFVPAGSDPTSLNYQRALRGLMTGNDSDCDLAVSYLADWEVSGNFRDAVRQQGDSLLLIYDWCHHRLSGAQITNLVARWNGYLDQENSDGFANIDSSANNYFWGRVRNNLLWGITSMGENPRAQEYIDNALDIRFSTLFADWYSDFGRGGVFAEGGDYGVAMLAYPLIAFQSAADYGLDPYTQTDFFREALYALIYGTTPGATSITGAFSGGHLLFPFNDDEHFRDGSAINIRDYLGDFARAMGQRSPDSGNARHIRAWLAETGAGRQWLFDALGGTGDSAWLQELPLDYYAPGSQVMDMRSSHDAQAMQVHLQLGTPGGVQHRHRDGGSFQIWRRGRWLSRESVGYAERLAGFNGVGTIDTEEAPAHNGLLFQGRSTASWIGRGPHVIPDGEDTGEQPLGLPRVVRLQHHPEFAYIAVDYSKAYRNPVGTRVDWPYADRALREFLFIRRMQALVILDRMRASGDSQLPFYGTANWVLRDRPLAAQIPAEQVVRTFVMHFETAPISNGNRLSATVGDQVVDLHTLLPSLPSFRIVDEDVGGTPAAGQYRLELDSSGSVESYFLNVISGRDIAEGETSVALSDLGDRWSIQMNHPSRGSATVVLHKGMDSTLGSVRLGEAATHSLYSGVQGIQVTTDGPLWESLPVDRIFIGGFEAL
ncbi:hypothetical protein [Pseudomarimonas arenosa]|uniref:Heparinase II/III-like protein n=1 Tax=Pseudomarimonas arenosa TaxID=2774145 RepID=A0AAW3ZLA2_9GAMM|nr:hypothetical protein [Pseudomarimonas arenosa]MBD8526294.1 hypothetical protein [Pseudomarimonas arenosa]